MKLMVQSYNNGGSAYNAEAEETAFLDYAPTHGFDNPAEVTIILSDPTGLLAQKYNVDANDVYVGPGKVTIEDPTGTDLFYGRIMKATANTNNRTLELYCQDWLSQLDDEQITYDMREKLSGNIRQSEACSDPDGDFVGPAENDGGTYYFYDNDMDWEYFDYDSMYLLFTVGMAGTPTIEMGPCDEVVTQDGGGTITTDLPVNGEEACWVKDTAGEPFSKDTIHEMQDAAQDWDVVYDFRAIAAESAHCTSISAAHIDADLYFYDVDQDATCEVSFYNDDGAAYVLIGTLTSQGLNMAFTTHAYKVPDKYLSKIVNSSGIVKVQFDVDRIASSNTRLSMDELKLRLTLVTTGYSSAIAITGTRKAYGDIAHAAMYEDGTGYTDETTDMASEGAGDVQLLPNPLSRHDAFYFGALVMFEGIKLTVSTAGVHDGTIIWQYWDGDSWESLVSVTDDTNGFETAGTNTVTWTVPSDWATTTVDGETNYYVRAYQSIVAPAITTTPLATQGWARILGNALVVGTDLSISGTHEIWEQVPYCIARPIYLHIESATGPILGGDSMVTLTCGTANVENTSGISTRQYVDKTRLEIMRDLARQDRAHFWMALGTTILTYKSAFTDAAPETLTDTDLNSITSTFDYSTLANEVTAYGARIGDERLSATYTDTTSEDKYNQTRTKVTNDAGLVSEYDALARATALTNQYKDVQQILTVTIRGNTAKSSHDKTLVLGDEVSITSTYLNLSAAVYIVQRFSYDSKSNMTTLLLHPRVSQVGLQQDERPSFEMVMQTNRRGTADRYIPEPSTNEVA